MKIDKQEVAMVMAIVWIFSVVAQIQQIGFWPSLLVGLPLGLLAGAAYKKGVWGAAKPTSFKRGM